MTRSLLRKARSGFTLIELLLVVGIIAILASIVIVAINPTRQLASARNAQRHSDVNTVINGIYQYAIDRNTIPTTITTSTRQICRTGFRDTRCTGWSMVGLNVLTGTYLVSIPFDPQSATASGTNYWAVRDANNRVTIIASGAELGESITVTR